MTTRPGTGSLVALRPKNLSPVSSPVNGRRNAKANQDARRCDEHARLVRSGGARGREIDRVRLLGLGGLRTLWRTTLRSSPPLVLTKDLMARMIAWHIQQQTLGGLDAATEKLLDGFARGQKSEGRRRLKSGTVLVREYQGERHAV